MEDHSYPPSLGGKKTTRRHFLQWLLAALAALDALIVGIPIISSLTGTQGRRESQWSKAGDLNSITANKPIEVRFPSRLDEAYYHETTVRSVWVIKHAQNQVTVFSPICPHLGCHYDWIPAENHFVCPCHMSVYSINGKVLSGPAPRPLDTLPARIENGILFVKWERFKVGISEKVRV